MPTWLDSVSDPRPVRAIYGDHVPSLERTSLHEVSLHRDGPRAVIRFDLADFPDHPPKKWLERGYDVVQVQIMLVGIWRFSLEGWTTEPVVNIEIAKENGGIKLFASDGPVRIEINSDVAIISSISAYKNG
jgi:Immunity protein 50